MNFLNRVDPDHTSRSSLIWAHSRSSINRFLDVIYPQSSFPNGEKCLARYMIDINIYLICRCIHCRLHWYFYNWQASKCNTWSLNQWTIQCHLNMTAYQHNWPIIETSMSFNSCCCVFAIHVKSADLSRGHDNYFFSCYDLETDQ